MDHYHQQIFLPICIFEEMNIDPKNPKMEDRDCFVLSKGHVAPGLYYIGRERILPKEDLVTLRHTGSYLQGHPDMKHIPGVDMSSDHLDRDFLLQLVWRQLESMTKKITVYTHFVVMEKFRKDRSGKQQCGLALRNWTTL